MTAMEQMTDRIVSEALREVRREAERRQWEAMEDETAERLPQLCRDTVAAARLGRLRMWRR